MPVISPNQVGVADLQGERVPAFGPMSNCLPVAADGSHSLFGQILPLQESVDGFADEPPELSVRPSQGIQTRVGLPQLKQGAAQLPGQFLGLAGEQGNVPIADFHSGQIQSIHTGAGNCAEVNQLRPPSRRLCSPSCAAAPTAAPARPCMEVEFWDLRLASAALSASLKDWRSWCAQPQRRSRLATGRRWHRPLLGGPPPKQARRCASGRGSMLGPSRPA